MKLVFDLNNLNRTADYLVQNNHILRGREDNPVRRVMSQLASAVEAKIREFPLSRLQDDAARDVCYVFEKENGVCFWLAIKGPDGHIGNTLLKQHGEPYEDEERYSVKELTGLADEFAEYTIEPQFFARLGLEPHTIGL